MRRQGSIVLVVVGVLVAVTAPVGWLLTRPPRTVGAAAADAVARTMPPVPAPEAGLRGMAGAVAVPMRDGRVGGRPAAGAVPVRVDLPSLGVSAAIRPVGVDDRGTLQIPADVAVVGWYRYGPRPGDPAGSTVLSGHLDSAEQGRGAFFRLRRLAPGESIVVHGSDGRARRYRVVARQEWPKGKVPLDRLFARTGAPRLTLVTCGGGFREDVGSYLDNVVVTAVPDGGP
jgi:hypothetical protein